MSDQERIADLERLLGEMEKARDDLYAKSAAYDALQAENARLNEQKVAAENAEGLLRGESRFLNDKLAGVRAENERLKIAIDCTSHELMLSEQAVAVRNDKLAAILPAFEKMRDALEHLAANGYEFKKSSDINMVFAAIEAAQAVIPKETLP